jgi:hypothetical protein
MCGLGNANLGFLENPKRSWDWVEAAGICAGVGNFQCEVEVCGGTEMKRKSLDSLRSPSSALVDGLVIAE